MLYLQFNKERTQLFNSFYNKVPFLDMLICTVPFYKRSSKNSTGFKVVKQKYFLLQSQFFEFKTQSCKLFRVQLYKYFRSCLFKNGGVCKRKKFEFLQLVSSYICKDNVNFFSRGLLRMFIDNLVNLYFTKEKEFLQFSVQQIYKLVVRKLNILSLNKMKVPTNIDILLYIYIKCNQYNFDFGSTFPTSRQLKDYSQDMLGLIIYLPEHFEMSSIIFTKLLNIQKVYRVSLVKINYQVVLNDLVRLQGLSVMCKLGTPYLNLQNKLFIRVYVDMFVLYTKLFDACIVNFKKRPISKCDLLFLTDYQIILYFRTIALGLLFYYRCVDNLSKIYAVINYCLRLSLIRCADL